MISFDTKMDAIKEKQENSNDDSLDNGRYTDLSQRDQLQYDRSIMNRRVSTQAQNKRKFYYVNQWDSTVANVKKRLH